MTAVSRIRRSLLKSKDDAFIRREFEQFGSPTQVSRALSALVVEGLLVRLGVGVYAKAKPSVLTGRPTPVKPLEVLAPAALAKLGVKVTLGRLARMYNEGRISQVPAGIVLNVGSRRIVRRLSFGWQFVRYERSRPRSGERAGV